MNLTHFPQRNSNRGSVLLVVLGTIIVLAIALAAVLSLTTHENRILARTATWNTALPVAEAGIEEAMSHLRQVNWGARGVNGWQADGSSFVLTREMSNGHDLSNAWYTVGISSATMPEIIAVGHAWCPSADRYIKRTIYVTTIARGVFNKGLLAKDTIVIAGTFSTDSFDSLKTELSTNGQYDPDKRSDNGDVGTMLSTPGAVTVAGVVELYGSVATGPAGTVKTLGTVSVGDADWIDGGNTGIQPDHHAKDLNVEIPNATLPYTNSGATPIGGNVGGSSGGTSGGGGGGNTGDGGGGNGTYYKYILEDGVDYRLSTLKMTSSDKMLVRGKARLVVDKDVSMAGGAYIQINTNASLELYVNQGTVSMSGSSILNQPGNAANFSLIGPPGLTAINISGNGTLIGTIYAPQAALKLSGGGRDVLDFIGAGTVGSVQGIGNFRFHYDESLAYSKLTDLVIASWTEL